ncbi:MAG: peptidase M14 [Burkholderiaceae bacterium]|nr:peptidase M14 [Burkholderiaceae bacterium]
MLLQLLTRNARAAANRCALFHARLVVPALLAGCASTPLPPWPAKAPLPPAERGRVVAPAPIAPPAQALPVPGPSSVAPWPSGAAARPAEDPLLRPALAAQFPEPMVRYRTPGLSEGRRAFTTNAELADWLGAIAHAHQGTGTRTQLLRLGPSQQGEPILALVLTRAGGTTPDALEASRRPTVMMVGQQRGDEPAGAEALLALAQELAGGLLEPLLDRINVVLVPRANPDGADAGTPETAAGVDMTSDHLLLSTPEARALAELVRDYRPILVLDAREYPAESALSDALHAQPGYDALLHYGTAANIPDFITKAAREWYYEPMAASLKAERLRSDWFFASAAGAGPVTGGSVLPETLRNVSGLKNAVGFAVASRGVGLGRAHVQRRVHTQVTAMASALRSTAERSSSLEQVRSFVARDTSAMACRAQAAIDVAPTPAQRDLLLLDPQSGAERVEHVQWDSPLKLRTLTSRGRPCGYWLAARADNVVDRLQLLGVQVLRVAEGGSMLADSYERSGPGASLQRNTIDAPTGSYYVALNQPLAQLAVAALEPDSPAGYVARGIIDDVGQVARIVSTPSLVFEEPN